MFDVSRLSKQELIDVVLFYKGKCTLQEEIIQIMFDAKEKAQEMSRVGYNKLNVERYVDK